MIAPLIALWFTGLAASGSKYKAGDAKAMPTIPKLTHDSPITMATPAPTAVNRATQVMQQLGVMPATAVIPAADLAQVGFYSTQPVTVSEYQQITQGDTWTPQTVYPGAVDVFGGTDMVYDPIYDPVTGALIAGWHPVGTSWDGTNWV